MSYLHEYEGLCRGMTGIEQLEENALAFKEWRNAQRSEEEAYARWMVICGVRLEQIPDMEATIIPFPVQRTGEQAVVEELDV